MGQFQARRSQALQFRSVWLVETHSADMVGNRMLILIIGGRIAEIVPPALESVKGPLICMYPELKQRILLAYREAAIFGDGPDSV